MRKLQCPLHLVKQPAGSLLNPLAFRDVDCGELHFCTLSNFTSYCVLCVCACSSSKAKLHISQIVSFASSNYYSFCYCSLLLRFRPREKAVVQCTYIYNYHELLQLASIDETNQKAYGYDYTNSGGQRLHGGWKTTQKRLIFVLKNILGHFHNLQSSKSLGRTVRWNIEAVIQGIKRVALGHLIF